MPHKSLCRSVHRLPRVGVLAAAALALSASLAAIDVAAQGQPAIQQRLDTVREQLFSGTGRPNRSIQELKAILAIDPDPRRATCSSGSRNGQAGSSDLMGEAVAELRQALALNDKYKFRRVFTSHIFTSISAARRGRARSCKQRWLSLRKTRNSRRCSAKRSGNCANPARAVELTRDALKVDPASDESRYYLVSR